MMRPACAPEVHRAIRDDAARWEAETIKIGRYGDDLEMATCRHCTSGITREIEK